MSLDQIDVASGEGPMTLDQVMPSIRALSLTDREKLATLLNDDLRKERELLEMLQHGGPWEVWSPIEAYGAANKLMELLDSQSDSK